MQNDGSISPVRAFFKNKWVKLIVALDIIAIIVVIGIIVFNATKTVTINFNVAPIDAKIQIDNAGDYTNGSYKVHPGNHEITISHDGLISKTFTIDLQSDYDTTLTAFLSGENNNFDFYELKGNYESFQKLASIASEGNNLTTDQDDSAYQFIIDYQQAYNLWQNKLPINYTKHGEDGHLLEDVTIRASNNCEITLCIEALMVRVNDKNFINSLLEKKGFKLENYEIIYKIY